VKKANRTELGQRPEYGKNDQDGAEVKTVQSS